MMIDSLFYLFSGLAVLSAGCILFTKNVLYAACGLVVAFLSVAALYVLAGAEFVAITQIMIYVGGIVVLIIFGVMLTNKISGKSLVTASHNKFFGLLTGLAVFGILLYTIFSINKLFLIREGTNVNNINTLGIGLMTDYILALEVAAVLLLVALVGAGTIAANHLIAKEKG